VKARRYTRTKKGVTITHRRTFTAEFKTQVVLDLLSGAHSAAELCRQHQLNPQVLARWKTEFLERAPLVFEQDQRRSAEQERIAELERLVGRLTMELEIAKAEPTDDDRQFACVSALSEPGGAAGDRASRPGVGVGHYLHWAA
jgi:transposase